MDILEGMGRYNKIGDIDKMLSVMQEANEKFPGNHRVTKYLIYTMGQVALRDNNLEMDKEIVEKGEYLLSECTDGEIRSGVIQVMIYCYERLGMKDKARQFILKNCVSIYSSSEPMLEALEEYGSPEKTAVMQKNMTTYFGFFIETMCGISESLSPEEQIKVYENAIKIYDMIFPNGDYGIHNSYIADKYSEMVGLYLKMENFDKAIEYLQKRCDHFITLDTLPIPTPHTSPLVNTLVYTGIWKNGKGNNSYRMLNSLEWKAYNPIRDTDRFREIEETLKQYADENG